MEIPEVVKKKNGPMLFRCKFSINTNQDSVTKSMCVDELNKRSDVQVYEELEREGEFGKQRSEPMAIFCISVPNLCVNLRFRTSCTLDYVHHKRTKTFKGSPYTNTSIYTHSIIMEARKTIKNVNKKHKNLTCFTNNVLTTSTCK